MGTTETTTEWSESARRYVLHRDVTWRDALQGSTFLVTSTAVSLVGAALLVLARIVRRRRVTAG